MHYELNNAKVTFDQNDTITKAVNIWGKVDEKYQMYDLLMFMLSQL